MERTTATGLTFALSAEAEPCSDDRPCAFCNPTELVEERMASGQERIEEILAEEGKFPESTLLTFVHQDDEYQGKVTGWQKHMGGNYSHKVELIGEPNRYRFVSHDHITDVEVPGEAGIVKADYIFRFGHEDGVSAEVGACDMCIIGAPVEVRGETAQRELQYHYHGSGEVRQHYSEWDEENQMRHHLSEPVEVDQ